MKIVMQKETRTMEVMKFVACDGEIFDNEADCRYYEAQLGKRTLEDIEVCYELDGFLPFDGTDHSEWHYYRWYKPKSTEELEKLERVYPDGCFSDFKPGQWICVETDSNDSYGWAYSLDDCILYAKEFLDKLGFELNIENKIKPGME